MISGMSSNPACNKCHQWATSSLNHNTPLRCVGFAVAALCGAEYHCCTLSLPQVPEEPTADDGADSDENGARRRGRPRERKAFIGNPQEALQR